MPPIYRPLPLKHVTYSTWRPAWEAIEEMRARAQALLDAVDVVEGCISHERPTADAQRRALDAFEQIPTLLLNFERAVAPRNVETLRRRLLRMRGVKARVSRRRK